MEKINNKYEHFKLNFQGLNFEIKLLDDSANFPHSDNKGLHEEFKVYVTNDKKTISFKFYNSQMEREISQIVKDYNWNFKAGEFKKLISKKFHWGGYDKIKNLKELTHERIYNLFYGIIYNISLDLLSENESFKDFCDNYGYDFDSRKAEKIYNEVIQQNEKIKSLKLSSEQMKYFNEEANQETEKFREDVKNAIKNS
jgi:hypothetical protein